MDIVLGSYCKRGLRCARKNIYLTNLVDEANVQHFNLFVIKTRAQGEERQISVKAVDAPGAEKRCLNQELCAKISKAEIYGSGCFY